jgi:cobyrinic acid a,c-diamide synthase
MSQPFHRLPRLVIAAPQGRSGKTTVSLGLIATLRRANWWSSRIRKDPITSILLVERSGWTPMPLGSPFFYAGPGELLQAFVDSARNVDLSVVEGNHGLFDSFDDTGAGSSAEVARTLKAPILLVVNAARLGRSAAAIVHGCQTFEPGTNIAGVVLNNVAHDRHEARLRQAIESHCGLPVIGAIPRDQGLAIPDRHLGLVPRAEGEALLPCIAACRQAVERHLDLEAVLQITLTAPPLSTPRADRSASFLAGGPSPRIGILRDRAFTFYYPENLEALEQAGSTLVYINALTDADLPPVDALYIGGGFPEIFMDELSANVSLRAAVRRSVENGLPVYAECGGMMYLSRRIIWGKSPPKWSAFFLQIEMTSRLRGHGYIIATVDRRIPSSFRGPSCAVMSSQLRFLPGEQPIKTAYSLSQGMVWVGD